MVCVFAGFTNLFGILSYQWLVFVDFLDVSSKFLFLCYRLTVFLLFLFIFAMFLYTAAGLGSNSGVVGSPVLTHSQVDSR